tara:strand:- start:360 stop:1520 length:1161 start_codon:yes stop_codon:yes gene_type:complete
MVRRKNKKKRQIKKEGITININLNQPTTKRKRRTPQKKQVGFNFKTGLDPNFRTFDPYIRSKVMELEQNNNAIQGNYLLKLKAIEDGRQQDINNLNNLQTRYNQLQSNFLSLSYDYTLQEQRQREQEEETRTEYDFDEDGYGAMGDGVDNSDRIVNRPDITGATNSVVNPSDNKVIDPEKEAKNVQIAFEKEVDSGGNITTPTPTAIARSYSQEGEAGEVITAEAVVVSEKSLPEPLTGADEDIPIKKVIVRKRARDEAGNPLTKKIGETEFPLYEDEKGKYIRRKDKKLYIERIKKALTQLGGEGIVEKEVKIVEPVIEKKRGVKKGTIRGLYYTFPQREKYSRAVFDRVATGEISENEAYNLDESVEYRKQRRKDIYGDKGGGK